MYEVLRDGLCLELVFGKACEFDSEFNGVDYAPTRKVESP